MCLPLLEISTLGNQVKLCRPRAILTRASSARSGSLRWSWRYRVKPPALTADAGASRRNMARMSCGRSIFFDIPEDEGICHEHPRDAFAPQKRLLELAERHIGDHFPKTAMHGLDQGLLLFRIGLLDVLLAQSFFFFVTRPTGEILAVAGHDRRWTDQRARELRAIGAGVKEVPAALFRRILLGAARRDAAPIGYLQIDVDADLLETVGRHQGE